ncbi:MAG: beta-ketoacyl synthase chain length factor [Cytophagaceae bacterium]|nr:beta-ketoacyl synthase chain length factor [Cytophagaceae bacterium]
MQLQNIYIGASSSVSIQETFDNPQWLESLKPLTTEPMKVVAPDYKKFLDPTATRRMSKVLKNSLLTARQAMEQQGITELDAVITATAWGCQEDTTKFLDSFESMGEELLSPTSFIQSTHNTIGGLIAMSVKCNGYNNTISHDFMSFETSLLDAVLLMKENKQAMNCYVGGIDELIDFSAGIFTKAQCFNEIYPVAEAATCFIVHNNEAQKKSAKLTNITLTQSLDQTILDLIKQNKPDLILSSSDIPSDLPVFDYRTLCGEFSTAAAFGLYLAAELLTKKAPVAFGISGALKKIAIINVYPEGRCSYLELEGC